MKERALVLEVKKRTCIVMTEDGNFRETPLLPGIHPGQEVLIPVKTRFAYLKPLLVAASLVVMLAAAGMYRNWLSPAVAAYVALDINPSVELALDKDSIVRGAEGLEPEGEKLLSHVKVKGMPLANAVDELLGAAINYKYISEEKDNIILTTVTVKPEQNQSVSKDKLVRAIEAPLQKANIKAQVVVEKVAPEIRDSARQNHMSTGRYLMYLEADSKGKPVNPEQFRTGSIRSIEKEVHIDLREIMDKNRVKYEKANSTSDYNNKQPKKESKLDNKPGTVVVNPVVFGQNRVAPWYERINQPDQLKKASNTVIKYWGPYINSFEKEIKEHGVSPGPDGRFYYSTKENKEKNNRMEIKPGNNGMAYPKNKPNEKANGFDNKRDITIIPAAPAAGPDKGRQTPGSNIRVKVNPVESKNSIKPEHNYLRPGADMPQKEKVKPIVTPRPYGNFSSFNRWDVDDNSKKAKSRLPDNGVIEKH